MASTRGNVVLIPFPFSDLTTTKTRPAVIVNSSDFQVRYGELLLAYLTSQIIKPDPELDYLLEDWQATGL